MGAGSAPVGVQAKDLLLLFRLGLRVAQPLLAVRPCARPPHRYSERAVGRALCARTFLRR